MRVAWLQITWLRTSWQFVRRLSGDDAYEHYLSRRAAHAADCTLAEATRSEPLSRREFYRTRQLERWTGIKRCC